MVVVLLSFFPPSCNGLDRPQVRAWLRFCFCSGRLFLWWLVVILVDGCGYALVFFFFFSSCNGLWLPWWCLWLVLVVDVVGCGCYNGGYSKLSDGRGGGGGSCYSFLCSFLLLFK